VRWGRVVGPSGAGEQAPEQQAREQQEGKQMAKDEQAAPDGEQDETGYQANVNQARREPIPASHQEERRPEAVVRNEEHAHEAAAHEAPQHEAPQHEAPQHE
jgi:hypothetical protein